MSVIKLRDILKEDSKVTFVFSVYNKNFFVSDEIKSQHVYELDTDEIAQKSLKNVDAIYMGYNEDEVFGTAKQLYCLIRDIRKVNDSPIYIHTHFTERKVLNLRNYEKFYTMIKEKFNNIFFTFGEIDDGKQSHFYRRKHKNKHRKEKKL